MAHKLIRLTEKLYNQPQLMTHTAFDAVVDYLENRNLEEVEINPSMALGGPRYKNSIEELSYNPDTKVGFLTVDGPLTYVPHYALCQGEASSYQRLLSDFGTMVAAGAKVVVIDADSPGGQAYGMMESASELRNIADKNGVKLITYADGLIASAMYGIAATSHEIIINPEGEAGSIGVVVSLANNSEKEKKAGVKRTYITAGDGKVPFDDDGEFTQEFKNDIQAKVDSLYDKFTKHVSQYRELSQEQVISYGARVYEADEALEKGLVDKVMTRLEFSNYLADIVEGKSESMALTNLKTNKPKDKSMSDQKVAELETSLSNLKTEFETTAETLKQTQSELSAALEKIASLEKEKVEAATVARKQKLERAVGSEKAGTLLTSLASLSDEAFETTLSALSASVDKSDDNEVGSKGAETTSTESLTAKKLAAKYNKTK